jgi:hypothetical protein
VGVEISSQPSTSARNRTWTQKADGSTHLLAKTQQQDRELAVVIAGALCPWTSFLSHTNFTKGVAKVGQGLLVISRPDVFITVSILAGIHGAEACWLPGRW